MESAHLNFDSAGWGPVNLSLPQIPGLDPTDDLSRLSTFVDFGQKIVRKEELEDDFLLVDNKLQSQPKLLGKFLQQKSATASKQKQSTVTRTPTVQRPAVKRTYRELTVAIQSSWGLIAELSKPNNDKLAYEVSAPEDVAEYGILMTYKKSQDSQVTPNKPKVLNSKQVDLKQINTLTASADPVLESVKGSANVLITDTVLVTLMTMSRSVYPWDITVTKSNGKIVFDKSEDSVLDQLTMNENNPEHMPDEDEPEASPNNPKKLSEEALRVNRAFLLESLVEPSQKLGSVQTEEPGVFKYRKWTIGDYQILVRTEIDAKAIEEGVAVPLRLFTVNEYDSNITGGYADKLDTRKGFIFSNEIKNNSCKMSKWALKAQLAGVEFVRIAYVTRQHFASPDKHNLLSVQKIRTKDLLQNLNLAYNNSWGVFKFVLDTIKNQQDGKYAIVKDHLKQVVRIYTAFEEIDEDFETS